MKGKTILSPENGTEHMKYTQGAHGRIFVIRLEHGEVLHESIEDFATDHKVSHAVVWALGGSDKGSKLVVGPEDGTALPVIPMELTLDDTHEMLGVGTIFPDKDGKPSLHMHSAHGRNDSTKTGCVRNGVKTWRVMEVVVLEIVGAHGKREMDKATGFELLNPRRPTMTDLTRKIDQSCR